MKNISIFFFLVVLPAWLKADPVYQLAQVDCDSTVFTIEILALVEDEEGKNKYYDPKKAKLERSDKKKLLTCKLKNTEVVFNAQVYVSSTGECGAMRGGYLGIYIDGTEITNIQSFGNKCAQRFRSVSVRHDDKIGGVSIEACTLETLDHPESKCLMLYNFANNKEIIDFGDLGILVDNGIAEIGIGGPSFDCNKAQSEVEKTICSDIVLSALDRLLQSSYNTLRHQLDEQGKAELRTEQLDWQENRGRGCRGYRVTAQCLNNYYSSRIIQLIKKASDDKKV